MTRRVAYAVLAVCLGVCVVVGGWTAGGAERGIEPDKPVRVCRAASYRQDAEEYAALGAALRASNG